MKISADGNQEELVELRKVLRIAFEVSCEIQDVGHCEVSCEIEADDEEHDEDYYIDDDIDEDIW